MLCQCKEFLCTMTVCFSQTTCQLHGHGETSWAVCIAKLLSLCTRCCVAARWLTEHYKRWISRQAAKCFEGNYHAIGRTLLLASGNVSCCLSRSTSARYGSSVSVINVLCQTVISDFQQDIHNRFLEERKKEKGYGISNSGDLFIRRICVVGFILDRIESPEGIWLERVTVCLTHSWSRSRSRSTWKESQPRPRSRVGKKLVILFKLRHLWVIRYTPRNVVFMCVMMCACINASLATT